MQFSSKLWFNALFVTVALFTYLVRSQPCFSGKGAVDRMQFTVVVTRWSHASIVFVWQVLWQLLCHMKSVPLAAMLWSPLDSDWRAVPDVQKIHVWKICPASALSTLTWSKATQERHCETLVDPSGSAAALCLIMTLTIDTQIHYWMSRAFQDDITRAALALQCPAVVCLSTRITHWENQETRPWHE